MNHIQIYDNILSRESCNNIIEYFNTNPNVGKAYTSDGLNESIKKGKDLPIDLDACTETMQSILTKSIVPCLNSGLEKYKKKFPFLEELMPWGIDPLFNIQKFDGKEEGYFETHCEAGGRGVSQRILVWMIYLNNAKCGTRFYYPTRDIHAKQGRLVIWPAAWTHPHSGITPNKGEKYLMTGWYSFY